MGAYMERTGVQEGGQTSNDVLHACLLRAQTRPRDLRRHRADRPLERKALLQRLTGRLDGWLVDHLAHLTRHEGDRPALQQPLRMHSPRAEYGQSKTARRAPSPASPRP